MQLEKLTFESIIANVIDALPQHIQEKILNVEMVIDREAKPEHLLGSGLTNTDELLGISEIIPSDDKYGFRDLIPSRIILFQDSITNKCDSHEEITTIISEELENHFLTTNSR